jgi:hypothetical protein
MLGYSVFTLIGISVIGTIVVTSHYFAFPHHKIYPFAFLSPGFLNPFTFSLYGILWFYCDFSLWLTITFIQTVALVYIVTVVPIVCEDLVPNRSNYRTNTKLRSVKNLPVEYRALEILHYNANSLVGEALIPMQATIGQSIVFCNFLLITRWEYTDGITKLVLGAWSGGIFLFWAIALELAGRIHSEGIKLLRSWEFWTWSKTDMKIMMKFRKSCKPLGVRAGRYFCVERISVLKFTRGIVESTFRALCITSAEVVLNI